MEDDFEDDRDFQIIEPLVSMVQERMNAQHRETKNWDYNIFTKERLIPSDLVGAARVIDDVEQAFDELSASHFLIAKITKNLKTPELHHLQAQMESSLRMQPEIQKSLEVQINALKVFWLPETLEEFFLGAYQKVRYPKIPGLATLCSICQESFSLADEKRTPVTFVRRCTYNPLLRLHCDQDPCTCVDINICLGCALSHLHKNGILEGKSSVHCPSCRGEFCIYDLQEIKI